MGEIIGWIAIAGFVAMAAWMSMGALADSLMVTTILTGGREPGDRREPDGVGVMTDEDARRSLRREAIANMAALALVWAIIGGAFALVAWSAAHVRVTVH